MKQKTIGIAGAGLIGRLLALECMQHGYAVTLFDRDQVSAEQSCTYAGGGMLCPWAELEKAELEIAQLGIRSLNRWPKILKKLVQPVFYEQKGSLIVAFPQDMNDLDRCAREIESKTNEPVQTLNSRDIALLEPELQMRFPKGLYFPEEGQLEPRELLIALEKTLTPHVTWHTGVAVSELGSGYIATQEKHYEFDWVFDSRGLGSKPQSPSLRGVRGELIRIHAPEVKLTRPIRLMHPRYPLYIVPRPDDVYLIGATSIESEHQGPVTVRSCLELLSAAYSLHPGFAEAAVLETVVGLRPAFPDNLPQITVAPGLTKVNGFYRHGFMIAPAVVEDAFRQMEVDFDPSYR